MTTKINELDIILHKDKFYIAQVVSETGAYLVEYRFDLFTKTDESAPPSIGYQSDINCCRLLVKPYLRSGRMHHLHLEDSAFDTDSIIIGRITQRSCGRPLFDISKLLLHKDCLDKFYILIENLNKFNKSRTDTGFVITTSSDKKPTRSKKASSKSTKTKKK